MSAYVCLDSLHEVPMPIEEEWLEATDVASGRKYYYHRITRETRWNKPPSEEKLARDRAFFELMEKNIKANIEQGKLMENEEIKTQMRKRNSKFEKPRSSGSKLFRTLSSLDDSVVQDYQSRRSFRGQCSIDLIASISEVESPTLSSMQFTSTNGSQRKARRPLSSRSNSTSTIFVNMGTMSAPDVDTFIKCTSSVLHSHISAALAKPIAQDHAFSVFNSRGKPFAMMPTLQEISHFMHSVYEKAQLEQECIIMSLIYVEKLLKATEKRLQLLPENWKPILFSSMVMASKVWDDLSMWNGDFSKICPTFTLERINELELAYLSAVQYNVRVAGSSYAKYYFQLRTMSASKKRLSPEAPGVPLNLEQATSMQVLSEQYAEKAKTKKSPLRRYSLATISTETLEQIKTEGYRFTTSTSPTACIEQMMDMNVCTAGETRRNSRASVLA